LDRGQPVRVLIADDHPLTREGLALAVRSALPGAVIDHAGSIGEAESAVAGKSASYRLVLLDLVLPDARGFSGFLKLQHLLGQTPIAIISAREEPMLIDAARALGAVGFLPKSRPLDELADMVRTLANGGQVFPEAPSLKGASAAATARSRLSTLSGAQLRVLLALADGRLNKQIAGDLQVTEATVKAHLTAIFRKLGVSNRTQALLAMQPLLGETPAEPELP
jgi:DNA-binding NarL/FixJ family response regulator